jgi:hypothetical protein
MSVTVTVITPKSLDSKAVKVWSFGQTPTQDFESIFVIDVRPFHQVHKKQWADRGCILSYVFYPKLSAFTFPLVKRPEHEVQYSLRVKSKCKVSVVLQQILLYTVMVSVHHLTLPYIFIYHNLDNSATGRTTEFESVEGAGNFL